MKTLLILRHAKATPKDLYKPTYRSKAYVGSGSRAETESKTFRYTQECE
jgi:hypothetical protein